MPFEETTINTKPDRADVMATISGSRPESLSLTLWFSADSAERLGIVEFGRVKVLVGIGKDAGTVDVLRAPNGAAQALKSKHGGVIVIRCGRHSSFVVPRAKSACGYATRGEKGETIEVKLPVPWPEKPFAKLVGRRAHKTKIDHVEHPAEETQTAAPAPHHAADAGGRPKPAGIITESGVTVSFARNAEKATYGKKTIDVTARQALAIAALAKNFGKYVGRSWLMNEVWPRKSAQECHKEFDTLIRDLAESVKKLGLTLVRGDGYALMAKRR